MPGILLPYLVLGAMVTVTYSLRDVGYYSGSRCTMVGQHLVHAHNRCQYVYCAYRRTPYGSALVGITRQCPPGTAVPSGLYAGYVTGAHREYHPMTLCSDRVYRPTWVTGVCSVHKMAYGRRQMYNYHPIQRKAVTFRYPRKRFYRPKKMISRIYNINKINKIKEEIVTTTEMPVMLNDMPDDVAFKPSVESKMAANISDISEPIYQNKVDVPVAPLDKGNVISGINDYQMDPDEEAEILKSLHKLLPVEEPEILSEEDSNKVKQEIMDMIFGDL